MDAHIELPGEPTMIASARAALRELLENHPRLQDILLVASELATNAVLHNGGAVDLHIKTVAGGALRIAVHDTGRSSWKVPEEPPLTPPEDEAGRGLTLIYAVADRAGQDLDEHGSTMWAEFRWDT